jgi:hypothetical protein
LITSDFRDSLSAWILRLDHKFEGNRLDLGDSPRSGWMNLAGPFKARIVLPYKESVASATIEFNRRRRDVVLIGNQMPALKDRPKFSGRYAANFAIEVQRPYSSSNMRNQQKAEIRFGWLRRAPEMELPR